MKRLVLATVVALGTTQAHANWMDFFANSGQRYMQRAPMPQVPQYSPPQQYYQPPPDYYDSYGQGNYYQQPVPQPQPQQQDGGCNPFTGCDQFSE